MTSKKIIKYGLYLILFLPLLFTNFTFFPWHYGKTVVFQVIVEVLVFFWLWGEVSRGCHSERSAKRAVEESLKTLNFLDWSILVFLVILIITALTSVNPQNSFWGNQARANGVFTWLHFGAFYFLLVNFFRSRAVIAIRLYFFLAVLVAVLASLTSIFPQILPVAWQSLAGGGIIGNRAFLAGYLTLAFGLSLYLFVSHKNKWRWLFLAPAVLFFYTIIDTGNRGALLGIAAGIFFGSAFYLFFVRNRKIKLLLTVFLVVLCSLFFIFLFSQRGKWIDSLTSGTGETRLMAWNIALKGFYDRPILGWGMGNYEIIFNKYYNPRFLQSGFTETVWDKPHNWVLEIVDSAGMAGLLVYLSIFIAAFYYLFKAGRSGSAVSLLAAALIAYFVQDLFLFETTNGLILWFLILAWVSAMTPSPLSGKSPPCQRDNTKPPLLTKRGLGGGLIILLIAYLLFLNLRSLRYSYYTRQAELSSTLMDWIGWADKALAAPPPFRAENAIFLARQLTNFDKAGVMVNNKDVQDAVIKIANILDEAAKKYSDNLALPSWAGQVYMVLGEKFDTKYYSEADRVLQNAARLSPRKQETWFLLGRLYLLEKNFDKAIESQHKAIEAAPDVGVSHWFLGLSYVAAERRDKGLVEIEKAQELGYTLTVDEKLYVLDLYALEKNYSKLIEEYKKMIEAEPENINWLVKLAAVYAASGDKKSAMETTRQAVGLFPALKNEAEEFIKNYQLDK